MRVPAVVERLSALRILDLTNNRLTNAGLPGSLARLPHLKAIGLKKNCLTAVPRVLGAMRSLQEIYLEDNTELEARPMPSVRGGVRFRVLPNPSMPSRSALQHFSISALRTSIALKC